MARKRNNAGNNQSRRQRRQRIPRALITATTGSATMVPNVMNFDLMYGTMGIITSTAGAGGAWQFRLNSLFDPDYTNVGHQPRGYDQLSALFERYAVEECHWEVQVVSTNAVSTCVACYMGDSTTVQSALTPDMPMSQTVLLSAGTGQPTRVVRGVWRAIQAEGVRAIDKDSLQALVSANPSDDWYLTIGVNSIDGSTTTAAGLMIRMRFVGHFLGRADVGTS